MRKHYFLLPLLLIGLNSYSQELKNKFGENYYTPDLYKSEYKGAEGSPYLNEQFKPSKINDIEETKLVRFDALNDQVEIMLKNTVMILDDSESYTIALSDGSEKVYKTKSYLYDNGERKRSFFELIHAADEFELYKKETIKFYKAVKTQAYKEGKPANFKKEQAVFYINNFTGDGTTLMQLPSKTRKFIELFPKGPKQIKQYIEDEKIDLDQADDLIQLFGYYFDNLN